MSAQEALLEAFGPPEPTAMQRAHAALKRKWGQESAPLEGFSITFKSGWRGCGEAMAAIAMFAIHDVEWIHGDNRHEVRFSCTFSTLKSVQKAMQGTPVSGLRCMRTHPARKVG